MTVADFVYLGLFVATLLAGTPVLGRWMVAVLRGEPPKWLKWLGPIEQVIYRAAGVNAEREMTWRGYAIALLIFHGLGLAALLALQLFQNHLPLNPVGLGPVPLGVAVNTAVSFITNTNWQAYSGEATMSYLTQMAGLGVQNFLSAAAGIAVLAALARGLVGRSTNTIGNFWADLVRSTVYLLVPISFVVAVVLIAQGVVMTFSPYAAATTLEGGQQVIPLGPAASQIAIKQLGTNGGGFFGVNSAHPLENPTPFSNFLQTWAILALPAACVYAFGLLVGARRHAWVVFGVMLAFFVAALSLALWSELASPGAATLALEGKEVRFGVVPSLLWANATTVASNGSVNAMHSSLSPIAGAIALLNMLLTDTLPASTGLHLPLVREDCAVGVLVVAPPSEITLTLAQRDLLEAFARQLALAIEREQLRAAGEREKLLAESEKLHRALLDSVSHELRTPLAVITSAIESIAGASEEVRASLINEAKIAARRLNRLVGNLLDQTRLETGALRPRLDWCDVHDLVNAALEAVHDAAAGRDIEVSIPDDIPPVHADFALTEQALANLLLNAALHTPAGTPIFLAAGLDRGARTFFTVADRGPGFPPAMRERLFVKFARGDIAKAGGLGLGLSIVRGFITAQGGEIVVGENPGGGAAITIYLPNPPRQTAPLE